MCIYQPLFTQVPNCDPTVPYFLVDLSGIPDSVWLSSEHSREGQCCGVSGSSRCTSFEVYLDSATVAIEVSIVSGAITGASFWQSSCTGSNPIDSTICLTGVGPHYITICKPGNNTNVYQLQAISSPIFPKDIITGIGCKPTIRVFGLDSPTITFNSIYPGSFGQYNNLLSASSGRSKVVFTPSADVQPYVDYEICGFPIADQCAFVSAICDTVRLTVSNNSCGVLLPVELISFKATPVDNESIHLEWTTVTEFNNDGFELHRSIDGIDFVNIAWIDGSSTTTNIINYSFSDNEVEKEVNYYYKLKQIDYDGQYEFSDIVSTKLTNKGNNNEASILLIPNPIKETGVIEIESNIDEIIQISLIDMYGKTLNYHRFISKSKTSKLKVDLSDYSKGCYLLIAHIGEDKVLNAKWLKF